MAKRIPIIIFVSCLLVLGLTPSVSSRTYEIKTDLPYNEQLETPSSPTLTLDEKIRLEADYILSCQYFNPGNPGHGAINNVYGDYPDWVVPRENAMAILGLVLAAETLDNTYYIERANLTMDYLVRAQDHTYKTWYDQYSYKEPDEGPVLDGRSPLQAAEVMLAMYKLGFDETRYDSMKMAAQYLFACQNHGYGGLICGGQYGTGSDFYTDNWTSDNSFAYLALKAAEGWALSNDDPDFATECAQAADEILDGINLYLRYAPAWYQKIDGSGTPNDPANYDWINYTPQMLDLPADGVGNEAVGTWIHDTFQLPNGGCIGPDTDKEYPGLSFQASFCWFDLGQNSYADDAINWSENSGLWHASGGWIDWISVSDPANEQAKEWQRFIDTSFYSIAAWLGGFDFGFVNNSPPQLNPIGDKFPLIGESLAFAISADDFDEDTLSYTAQNLPAEANFDEETQTFNWTPDKVGNYVVRFEVRDKYLMDYEDVTITVRSETGVIRVPQDYPTIQYGIDAAIDTETVLVSDGVYTGNGNWDIDFLGKAITVKSENGPQTTIIEPNPDVAIHGGFTFTSQETENSVLQGFTIRKGYKNYGAAIHIEGASPTIKECIIENNISNWGAGGIDCYFADPKIIDCIIRNNQSSDNGGGISCRYSDPVISNTIIEDNNAGTGGGIFCDNGSPVITDCTIKNNTSGGVGGGLYLTNNSNASIANCVISSNTGCSGSGLALSFFSEPTIRNSIFSKNTSVCSHGDGGAIWSSRSVPKFYNCTISRNTSQRGGGAIGVVGDAAYNPEFVNSILWNNYPDEIYVSSPVTLPISYSNVRGGYPGTGNINVDPGFISAALENYNLHSFSPCIDAADGAQATELDIEGNPRYDDLGVPNTGTGIPKYVDMGALERHKISRPRKRTKLRFFRDVNF